MKHYQINYYLSKTWIKKHLIWETQSLSRQYLSLMSEENKITFPVF